MIRVFISVLAIMIFAVFAFIVIRYDLLITWLTISDGLFFVGAIAALINLAGLTGSGRIFRPISYSFQRIFNSRSLYDMRANEDSEKKSFFDYTRDMDEKRELNNPYTIVFFLVGIGFVIISLIINSLL